MLWVIKSLIEHCSKDFQLGCNVFRDMRLLVSASVLCSSSTFAMILADTFRGIIFGKTNQMGEAEASENLRRAKGPGVDFFRDPTIPNKKNSRENPPENLKNYPPRKKNRTDPVTVLVLLSGWISRTSRFGRICDRSLKIHEQLVHQKIHLVKEKEKHPTTAPIFWLNKTSWRWCQLLASTWYVFFLI